MACGGIGIASRCCSMDPGRTPGLNEFESLGDGLETGRGVLGGMN